ncbi:hypothetical protein ACPTGO_30770, partial [Pseudomonas aeruginosa]|uniref:hypothetical protein n=1 Tax=Pseudomonas aeruginosa TaxID=287 RepID=UPI003CC53D34
MSDQPDEFSQGASQYGKGEVLGSGCEPCAQRWLLVVRCSVSYRVGADLLHQTFPLSAGRQVHDFAHNVSPLCRRVSRT